MELRMQQRKNQFGSIVFNRRSQTWRLFMYDAHGKRRTKTIGTRRELPTKSAARLAAQALRDELLVPADVPRKSVAAIAVAQLVENYRAERMPTRYSTRRSYDVWLRCYVLPRWGAGPITDMQARPVELWLTSLPLSPRSKSDIRALIGRLWDCAMWRDDVPVQRNPMQLVRCPGSSKRTHKPRSLTAQEFQRVIAGLREPFQTIVLVCACFGLRISECLALKWSDIDWRNARLRVQRGIIRNRVGDCKTNGSDRELFIGSEMSEVLMRWKQVTEFRDDTDWMFASPSRCGRQPWSYDAVLRALQKAASVAGISNLGTHSLRHSFRSWLDAVGTPISVQRELMRHSDIRTTMNVYGSVVTDEMSVAHTKVAKMVFGHTNSTQQQHTAS